MKFKTSITSVNEGNEIVRGENLLKMIKEKTFTEVIFLILKGKLPNKKETAMLNACLSSMIDHGPGVSSALTARVVQSAGNDLHVGVAAGLLALGGRRHGGALGGAAEFFQKNVNLTSPLAPLLEERGIANGGSLAPSPVGRGTVGEGSSSVASLVKSLKDKKVRIPGFGHKVLTKDARTEALFEVAKENGFFGKHCEFALKVGEELNKISSKPLPLNMDGANAAIISDMGFPAAIITGFFLIGRTPGLVAQVYEEMNSGEGIRRLDENDIEYTGKL